MGYRLTRAAAGDVSRIYLDSARQFGSRQADTYHELLEQTFRFLAENPRAARRRPELTGNIRIHPIKSHIVIYQIEATGDVLILRVRHGHEDWADGSR